MELQRRSIRINAPPLPLRHGQVLRTWSQGAVNCVSTKRDGKRSDTEPTTVFAASTLLTLTCPAIAGCGHKRELFPHDPFTPAGPRAAANSSRRSRSLHHAGDARL